MTRFSLLAVALAAAAALASAQSVSHEPCNLIRQYITRGNAIPAEVRIHPDLDTPQLHTNLCLGWLQLPHQHPIQPSHWHRGRRELEEMDSVSLHCWRLEEPTRGIL